METTRDSHKEHGVETLQEIKINPSKEPSNWEEPYNIECPCCLEIPPQARVILDCRHLLCISCFVKHIRRSTECPICRVNIKGLSRVLLSRNTPPPAPPFLRNNVNNFINHEITRRLQHHIDEVAEITENHAAVRETFNQLRRHISQNSHTHNTRRHINLRDAPPLTNSRSQTSEVSDRTNRQPPPTDLHTMTTKQCIIVTAAAIVDIFIMILWLYTINQKHVNN